MAKTKEELNALKEEVEAISRKLQELTDEELDQVFAGEDGSKDKKYVNPNMPIDIDY